MKKWLKLLISLLLCLTAGFIGSFFTMTSIDSWYSTLNRPSFNPPDWVFGPVWTILYVLMGISLYLVWDKKSANKMAYSVFYIQLILNTLWSLLFFGLQSPLLAFIEIAFLWISIVLTVYLFYKISKPAAYLLVPYLLWVSFASVLNLSIYLLN